MSEDFTTDDALVKCHEFIYALPGMTDPDFRVVRLCNECVADPWLVEGTKLKFINCGAKWLRITVDVDGDTLIEGWK